MSTSQTVDSLQVKLVREFIEGFNKKDVNIIAKNLHKDYRRILYPRSLGKPAVPREEWLEQCGKMISHWIDPQTIFHSIVDAPGKVVAHISSEAKTTFGAHFSRELIMTFEIVTDDDGSLKIGQLEEFVDSKAHLDDVRAIALARANK